MVPKILSLRLLWEANENHFLGEETHPLNFANNFLGLIDLLISFLETQVYPCSKPAASYEESEVQREFLKPHS